MSMKMKWLAVLGILMGVLLVFGVAAAATATTEIGVKISLDGTPPKTPEVYTVRLTAIGDNPMPAGATGKTYDLKITGDTSAKFPPITFDRVGIYYYSVEQLPGKVKDAKYDRSVYEVKVSVYNTPDGLASATAIRRIGDGTRVKLSQVQFNNVYRWLIDLTVIKEWRGDNNNADRTRPASVLVDLYANGKRLDTAVLNAANKWRVTFDRLPVYDDDGEEIEYTWVERNVEGYEQVRIVTDTGDGTATTTITNSRIYTLTVYYIYLLTGETAAPTVTEDHPAGENYNVVSPVIPGYICDRLVVAGKMPAHDVVEYVYYIPENLIIDDLETPLGLGQVFINVGDCLE